MAEDNYVAGFHARVLRWLRTFNPAAEAVLSVEARGYDMLGDTEGGFHEGSDVTIKYAVSGGAVRTEHVEGSAVADLWHAVMAPL